MKAKYFLLIILSFAYILKMAAQDLALANFDNTFGYINKEGVWQIPYQFKSAKNFSEDMAEATMGDKWGYINRHGEWAIPPQFDKVNAFNSGTALVNKDNRWFYINKNGEEVLENVKTTKFYDFENGFAIIRNEDDKVGFINTSGEVIAEPKFDKVLNFLNGHARVKIGDYWGIIDANGQLIVNTEYKRIGDVYAGNIVAEKDGNIVGLIIDGQFKIVEGADKVWDFAYNNEITHARKGNKIGYINNQAEWVIEPQFDEGRAFLNGLAPVMQKKKWGYIDPSGKVVIDFQFKDADLFSEDGLAPVKIKKMWGFIDKSGTLVIEDLYDIHASLWFVGGLRKSLNKMGLVQPNFGFMDGLARVKYNKKWGFIDKNGKLLMGTWFNNLELFK